MAELWDSDYSKGGILMRKYTLEQEEGILSNASWDLYSLFCLSDSIKNNHDNHPPPHTHFKNLMPILSYPS